MSRSNSETMMRAHLASVLAGLSALPLIGPLTLRSITLVVLLSPATAMSQPATIDDFTSAPATRWRFFTDGVMGGVSTGRVVFSEERATAFARLTGEVSTANNGGFIQMRTSLPDGAPAGSAGVRVVVRGNGERYFVHLRTTDARLPWQFHQAGFPTSAAWEEIRLPFESFKATGGLRRDGIRPDALMSLGIVAYGRDHEARIDIREIGFY